MTPKVVGRGHYAAHGKAIINVGAVSVLGIAATFGFQILTARLLGPTDFGVLSAFFAIVSMAAIGSSSLQNAVAVETARAIARGSSAERKSALDGFTLEALVLGGLGSLVVLVGTPAISASLRTELYVPVLASVSILLSFLFARAVGGIQGTGDSLRAVAWSSVSLILRCVLVGIVLFAGFGLGGALASVLVGSLLATAGAVFSARKLGSRVTHRAFELSGVLVLLMTVLFAWLTNVDVILVRIALPPTDAGFYAAAAVLVKAGFLIPATLSLYLLPRFVRQENNAAMTRLGVRVTLVITGAGGIAIIAFLAIAGSFLVKLLFGESYDLPTQLLAGLAVAYLPWIMAQGLLIRMSALGSKVSVVVLAVAAVVIWLGGMLLLPDLAALLVLIGVLGSAILLSFLVLDFVGSRRMKVSAG